MPEDVLEDILKTLKASHQDKVQYFTAISNQLNAQYGQFESWIETLYEDRLSKRITTEDYDRHIAPIIKELFELYATGNYSILEIQDWLADKNIVSKNGTGLGHSVINNILRNPFYYGYFMWNKELYEGKHQPLVTKKVFDQVQDVLMRRSPHRWHAHEIFRKKQHFSLAS